MTFEQVKALAPKPRVSPAEILNGYPIPPLKRLEMISEDDFEELVQEWAYGYLKNEYVKVERFGGAGDKGRDVLCTKEDGGLVIYQCKHYGTKIAPSHIYLELGKLCYYTFEKVYKVPDKYYIVSSKGVGPSLKDLIAKPDDLKSKLIESWEAKCQKDITKKKDVKLISDFGKYVRQFDFSIVDDIEPIELINQHRKTWYHARRFGGGLTKTRELRDPTPSIEDRELPYTSQLFKIYCEETGKQIQGVNDLSEYKEYLEHFENQRRSFFSADSLEKFSRDNFPDVLTPPFIELLSDSLEIVKTNLNLNKNETGYNRLETSVQNLLANGFNSNALSDRITSLDKRGLGNYLANEDKVKWIIND